MSVKIDSHTTRSGVQPTSNPFGPLPAPPQQPVGPGDSSTLSEEAQEKLTAEAHDGKEEARSELAWNAVKENMGLPGGVMHAASTTGRIANAWDYSQALSASLDQAKVTGNYTDFNNLYAGLQKYAKPDGSYGPHTNGTSGEGASWYDDNAWIGLANMQAYKQTRNPKYLQSAEKTCNFLQTGMVNGGLEQYQGENPPTFNTCAEAPAAELAMQLHMATAKNPHDTTDKYFQFAQQLNNNMNQYLREPNGLYRDRVNAKDPGNLKDSGASSDLYSYNQGTPIGLNVLFYQATGDKKYLQAAQQTAATSLQAMNQGKTISDGQYAGQTTHEGQAFNAIYFRNLMQLNAVAPNQSYTAALGNYANLAWQDGRDPISDLFGINGMSDTETPPPGSEESLIDQSGMTQIYSLLAMNRSDYADLT